MENISITTEDVEDIIKSLNANKAVGIDGISHKLLKGTIYSISKPLCILFNKSICQKTFPNCWKQANIIPLFKKDDKSIPSNYRPVSLLSCVGKVLERIIFKNVYNFLYSSNIFYKYQSGFVPGHSTVSQLIEMFDSVCKARERRENTCIIFCDLSKAFDRVWHEGLLFKLNQYGIRNDLLEWFQDYLNNRQQRVLIGDSYSNFLNTNAGVPQGSVLGPLLFLVYVNDLMENMSCFVRLFADDSSLQYSSPYPAEIEIVLNHDLETLITWSKLWLMKFNPNKTNAMWYSHLQGNGYPELVFDNIPLNFIDRHKHLGITFQNDYKWTYHIENLVQTASKKIAVMRSLKYKLNRTTLSTLYIVFIRPVLEYADVVWDGCNEENSEKLEKLQLDAAKIVTGLPCYASRESLYQETGWEPLKERRFRHKLTFLYKIINGNAPLYLEDLLPIMVGEISSYPLRNRNNFNTPRCRYISYEKSFFPSSINLWNNLSDDIKSCQSISQFKRKITQNPNSVNTFNTGNRKISMIYTKLRYRCSTLKEHLHRVGLVLNPTCECGEGVENSEHFLLLCNKYIIQRDKMLYDIRQIIVQDINANLLLFGNSELPNTINEQIYNIVCEFISTSGRFDPKC